MTLVISLINREHAIQVSDRRFVWPTPSGQAGDSDNERNKAVVFQDRFAFSFTGVGELGAITTDVWLADVLGRKNASLPPGNHDPQVLFQEVADRATAQFQRGAVAALSPTRRRHAFVVLGWARFAPRFDAFESFLALVSNFHTPGRELAEAQDQFAVQHVQRSTASETTDVYWFGQDLGPREQRALRSLRRVKPTAEGYARAAIRLLGQQVRAVSARNDWVGWPARHCSAKNLHRPQQA